MRTLKLWKNYLQELIMLLLSIIQNGGKAMKHPDFYDKLTSLYEDSCHLSLIGNDIF